MTAPEGRAPDAPAAANGSESGELELAGEARFERPSEGGGHARLVFQKSSQPGTVKGEFEEEAGTCAYDLSHLFDAARSEIRVTGSACGEAVELRSPSTL